jgi:predicted nucleotidyltransferase
MQIEAYQKFTQQLIHNLNKEESVLGLVAVGSMARQDHQPDEWSDHDFWVITHPGAQERFRREYDWLPRRGEITWAFQETEHGVKVIYQDGHLLEFAVFDTEELKIARINRYRVLLDRAQINAQMAEVAAQTEAQAVSGSDTFHAGQFLTNLLVGIGRYWRGEKLSAHKFVKINAIHHLVTLLNRHAESAQHTLADNIDPTRRFESTHPHLGTELEMILLKPIPEAAQGLLALMQHELPVVLAEIPSEVVPIIGHQIQNNNANSGKMGAGEK